MVKDDDLLLLISGIIISGTVIFACVTDHNTNKVNNIAAQSTVSQIEAQTNCALDDSSRDQLANQIIFNATNGKFCLVNDAAEPVTNGETQLNKPYTLTGYKPSSMETITIAYTLQNSGNGLMTLTYEVDK